MKSKVKTQKRSKVKIGKLSSGVIYYFLKTFATPRAARKAAENAAGNASRKAIKVSAKNSRTSKN